VDLGAVREEIERRVKRGPRLVMVWKRRRTARAAHVIEQAAREAEALGHREVGTGHLFLGILADGRSVAAAALAAMGVDFRAVRERVVRGLRNADRFGDGSV
jgi:ATP-dependent Clp protease ATP-binding subunit ClpA